MSHPTLVYSPSGHGGSEALSILGAIEPFGYYIYRGGIPIDYRVLTEGNYVFYRLVCLLGRD